MIHIPLWLAALLGMVSLTLAIGAIIVLALQQKSRPKSPSLPDEWALTGRAVFSTHERRLFRLLSETLSQHIILAKLPMVRFCQPIDFGRTRYWYDLLGSNYVSFAICASNGRVLAAIDIDKDRYGDETSQLRLSMKIKRAALRSCRIRYLRVPAGATLTEAEIKLLVSPARGFFDENFLKQNDEGAILQAETPPSEGSKLSSLTAETTARLVRARESLASAVASRRAQRKSFWVESNSLFQDSFFALDSRFAGSDPQEAPVTLQPKLTEEAFIPMPPRPEQAPVIGEHLSEQGGLEVSLAESNDQAAFSAHGRPEQATLAPPPVEPPIRSQESLYDRRQPLVVNITLEDAVPSEQLREALPLGSEEARHVARAC